VSESDADPTQGASRRSWLTRLLVLTIQSRTTLFGPMTWDTSLHDFLRLRVRSSGDQMRYFVNIQTDGPGEHIQLAFPKSVSVLTCVASDSPV
jgi:hypothetical protein